MVLCRCENRNYQVEAAQSDTAFILAVTLPSIETSLNRRLVCEAYKRCKDVKTDVLTFRRRQTRGAHYNALRQLVSRGNFVLCARGVRAQGQKTRDR